ncbi:MAG: hypothetical protein EPN57_20680 [Paraburkholderia sp.]|nr:MAG: hypothetical protein EPN57_20680 [Paraburkholderia sp.]
MHSYARIVGGFVVELISPAIYDIDSPPECEFEFKCGDEVPIERRFTADIVAQLVDITPLSPQPSPGWTFDGNKFFPPKEA